MTIITRNKALCAFVLFGAILVSTNSFASDYPFKEKLQQCEAAFEKMHSGDLAQKDAWKVRNEHMMLVREILENLNKRNHAVMRSQDRTMSSDEVLDNFLVMGSLLEMLATKDLRIDDEWGYPLSE